MVEVVEANGMAVRDLHPNTNGDRHGIRHIPVTFCSLLSPSEPVFVTSYIPPGRATVPVLRQIIRLLGSFAGSAGFERGISGVQ